MTSAPPDLLAFRQNVITLTGLDGVSVGIVGDSTHAATGGYHEGQSALARVGRYHTWAAAGSSGEDYSVRLQRDRNGLTDHASAIDIGYQWPHGGNQAWLRFNALLAADLHAGHPALAAIRAVNYSPDGTLKRRIDREYGFAVEVSSDSVDIHTHIECYRDTEGRRQNCLDRLTALIQAAVNNTSPQEDDMSAQAESVLLGLAEGLPTFVDGNGKTQTLVPVVDIIARQKWQASVDQRLTALAALAAKPAGGAPTQDQVNTAVLAALKDPAVQAGIGAAIASHIKVA